MKFEDDGSFAHFAVKKFLMEKVKKKFKIKFNFFKNLFLAKKNIFKHFQKYFLVIK
jgi:hypothetical protein